MDVNPSFDLLEAYKLKEIQVTDRELGHGSYATVLELEYMGLKCAGKKIHDELLRQEITTYGMLRFKEECRLLSQVRHPNIVQFLGIYFQQGVRAPILVMEFLPTNLTSCIEQYGILPKEISYSILHDVALGLCYLHSQTPPIIHRDLSSNNILLTSNMTAKISDLGVAKIINLTPLQFNRMTQTPGTPHFMPPEVMIPNPLYDISVDIFSYGIMLIHIFSGKWPEPQVGPNKFEAGKLLPASEAERREAFLRTIGNKHPLMDLVLNCISNDPQKRPHVHELERRLAEMMLQFPTSIVNPLELLCPIRAEEGEKRATETIQVHRNNFMKVTKRELDNLGSCDMEFQMEHLQLQIEDLQTQKQVLECEKKVLETERNLARAETVSLKRQTGKQEEVLNDAILSFERSLSSEKSSVIEAIKDEHKHLLEKQRQVHEQTLQRERQKSQQMLQEIHEECQRKEAELVEKRNISDELKAESITSKTKIELLKSTVSTLEETLVATAATISVKDAEVEVKSEALQQREYTISGLNEQLTRAMEFLVTKKQVSLAEQKANQIQVLLVPMKINSHSLFIQMATFTVKFLNCFVKVLS
jgi:serine/threonine protein kinase